MEIAEVGEQYKLSYEKLFENENEIILTEE